PQVFLGNIFYDLKFIPFFEVCKYVYLLIIVIPFLIVDSTALKLFGSLIMISFLISQLFFQVTLVSVWCFFAALLSSCLYLSIKHLSFDEENQKTLLISQKK
ncbi:DUF6629 family protein, partial [Crocosphaera chwakensis]